MKAKKLLSLILSLLMLMSVLPLTALAADTDNITLTKLPNNTKSFTLQKDISYEEALEATVAALARKLKSREIIVFYGESETEYYALVGYGNEWYPETCEKTEIDEILSEILSDYDCSTYIIGTVTEYWPIVSAPQITVSTDFATGSPVLSKEICSVPDNAGYCIYETKCFIGSNRNTPCTDDTFTAGNAYICELVITTTDGYVFDEECNYAIINGEKVYGEKELDSLTITKYINLGGSIDTVALTTELAFKAGDPAPSPEDFQVPENAHYHIGAVALEGIGNDGGYSELTAFQANYNHYVYIDIIPDDGYYFFIDEYECFGYDSATLNGENMESAFYHLGANSGYCVKYRVNLCEDITTVTEIPLTFTEPLENGCTLDDTLLQLPENVPYRIGSVCYYIFATNLPAQTYEKDCQYYAYAQITLERNASFGDITDLLVTVNGKRVYSELYYYSEPSLMIFFNFGANENEEVEELSISALPVLAQGDIPAASEVILPDEANYSVRDFALLEVNAFTDVDEVTFGKYYLPLVVLTPKDGYCLNYNTYTSNKINAPLSNIYHIYLATSTIFDIRNKFGVDAEVGDMVILFQPTKADHIHSFTLQNVSAATLKSPATCVAPAAYYCTCACGKVGSEQTFTVGTADANAHKDDDNNGKCDVCNADLSADEPTDPPATEEEKLSFIQKLTEFFNKILDFFKNLLGM